MLKANIWFSISPIWHIYCLHDNSFFFINQILRGKPNTVLTHGHARYLSGVPTTIVARVCMDPSALLYPGTIMLLWRPRYTCIPRNKYVDSFYLSSVTNRQNILTYILDLSWNIQARDEDKTRYHWQHQNEPRVYMVTLMCVVTPS